jgi:hypothetical protein
MRSSAYEHLIPERLFSTEEEPAEGVSTAKALALAMAQGQRIYTLTQDNAYNLSQITIDSEARSEIQSALQRGYEVTVHETPLNVNGWEGSGYSIIDPENGIGAYKISGGASGGALLDGISILLTTLATFYSALDALAATLKSVVPLLGTVSRALTAISFFHEVMKTGATCNGDVAPVLLMMAMTTIMVLGIVALVSLANPLVGFAVGLVLDRAVSWFIGQAQNCR